MPKGGAPIYRRNIHAKERKFTESSETDIINIPRYLLLLLLFSIAPPVT